MKRFPEKFGFSEFFKNMILTFILGIPGSISKKIKLLKLIGT